MAKSLSGRTRVDGDRLNTPTDLAPEATKKIAEGLTVLLSDLFALYVKTKNFHWHVSGPNFRDYHLMLDEQSQQIFAIIDDVGERARKIGGTTLRSLGQASRLSRVEDNDAEYVSPLEMLAELRDDNKTLTANMRELHEVTDEAKDVSTTSLLEEWINQSEERTWFLYEATRNATEGGH
ncbi:MULTISPECIES: Dps family protein [unclassified Methylobacterium]|jgi:starvation-inducible DNA-binding protein|uniref:Dps family protein n=1 Tax=unclassified Methylobacterium TaxID=2615210 RepID=UPI0007021E25|nr:MULTISPECIES: DNA starvation/stationary phase protection protein [unclassified Methylobacterium]KQO49174.1 DNA starvation/stationary phase protection protein [Methylobacterium sp. Leaf86]KQP00600.1 DNA starvation/stationary phase protection protein [Methylobacterium sp. Leaf91]MBO1019377.1 DNA starvation/stationary phase protection protein [Methylobacterium sp. SD274]